MGFLHEVPPMKCDACGDLHPPFECLARRPFNRTNCMAALEQAKNALRVAMREANELDLTHHESKMAHHNINGAMHDVASAMDYIRHAKS